MGDKIEKAPIRTSKMTLEESNTKVIILEGPRSDYYTSYAPMGVFIESQSRILTCFSGW